MAFDEFYADNKENLLTWDLSPIEQNRKVMERLGIRCSDETDRAYANGLEQARLPNETYLQVAQQCADFNARPHKNKTKDVQHELFAKTMEHVRIIEDIYCRQNNIAQRIIGDVLSPIKLAAAVVSQNFEDGLQNTSRLKYEMRYPIG